MIIHAARRHGTALTYPAVGATRSPELPSGYHHVDRTLRIGHGRRTFDHVAEGLLSWQMHRYAGMRPDLAPIAPDTPTELLLGAGPVKLGIPCRIIYVTTDPARRGFAYGTLPGHPETGEEAFHVTIDPRDEVHAHIRAFSRPANLLVRLGGPLPGLAQRYFTNRYFAAFRRLAQETP